MSAAEYFSLEAANAGKGVAIPGVVPLADTGHYRNPYLASRSGFDTVISLRGDTISFESVHRDDCSVGFACKTTLHSLNMSYARALGAFAKQNCRAAKLRLVEGRMVIFIGTYIDRRFTLLEAAVPMEPLSADARPDVLAKIQGVSIYLKIESLMKKAAREAIMREVASGQ